MGAKIETIAAAIGLASLLVKPAAAQESSASNAVSLPQIVVSPTMVPTPSNRIASSVTVITAQDLQREQIRTVPDALKSVPGLNVVQSGGVGAQTSIFMRGTNSNHVKVFIDGIEIGDPSSPNGAFDFAHLLTGDVERIEVLRGPQSGLYGADAIGGVIWITTKKGEGPAKASATAEGGSLGTFNQAGHLSGSQGNFNYAFNILHLRSTDVPVTPLDLLAPGEKRNNDTYDNWTYSTKLGADLSDNFAVNFVARYTDAKHRFTGDDAVNFPPNAAPEVLQDTQVNHQLFTRGEAVWSLFDGKFKNYFGVNYSNQWAWAFNPNPDSFTPFGSVAPPVTNVGERTKFDWRGEIRVLPGQTLVLGAEDETQRLRTDSTGSVMGGVFVPVTTRASNGNKAAYAELQSSFADRFFLTSNIRIDDNDSFGSHVTWRIAPAFIVPVTETKLKATYGTGFKAPTLTQLFVNNPTIGQLANPNLKPEFSKGYDFGFEQPLFDNRLRFGVTYFHNDITDLINPQFNPNFTFVFVNLGDVETHGIEAFATAVITPRLKVRADYTHTIAKDATTGLELLRRPQDKFSASLAWLPADGLTVSATLLHVGSWIDVNRDTPVFIPRLNASPYTVVNLAADYAVNNHVTVFGRIDNLFDRDYQNPVGFLHPGFSVFGGVRVSN